VKEAQNVQKKEQSVQLSFALFYFMSPTKILNFRRVLIIFEFKMATILPLQAPSSATIHSIYFILLNNKNPRYVRQFFFFFFFLMKPSSSGK